MMCPPGIELTHCIADETVPICGDALQLHRAVMNLCINALQAMEQKGGALHIQLDCSHLGDKGPATAQAPFLRLQVRDTGCGIESTELSHIFAPFYTTKAASGGTGLGLSLVNEIIKMHGGSLLVESTVGQGSTFYIYLPVAHL
jgi:signal transduction histidine kinase